MRGIGHRLRLDDVHRNDTGGFHKTPPFVGCSYLFALKEHPIYAILIVGFWGLIEYIFSYQPVSRFDLEG